MATLALFKGEVFYYRFHEAIRHTSRPPLSDKRLNNCKGVTVAVSYEC